MTNLGLLVFYGHPYLKEELQFGVIGRMTKFFVVLKAGKWIILLLFFGVF